MLLSSIVDFRALTFSSLSALWRGALEAINVLWEFACQMPWYIFLLFLPALIGFLYKCRKR